MNIHETQQNTTRLISKPINIILFVLLYLDFNNNKNHQMAIVWEKSSSVEGRVSSKVVIHQGVYFI